MTSEENLKVKSKIEKKLYYGGNLFGVRDCKSYKSLNIAQKIHILIKGEKGLFEAYKFTKL